MAIDNKRIFFKNKNGIASIIVPSPECLLTIEELAKKDVPDGKPYKIVDVGEVSSNREFRNAWIVNDDVSKICICCTKAKGIALQDLRNKRDPLFEALDKEFMFAIESGDESKKQDIVRKKVLLRESTNALKALDTSEKIDDEETLSIIRKERDQSLSHV